jgi:DUF1365 family protein
LASALYRGFIRHRRFTPEDHQFRYPLFMVFLKLSELTELTGKLRLFGTRPWHWARFRRADYLGDPSVPLDALVKQRIGEKLELPKGALAGDVYFFGHLRYLGFYFSPLNLYFVEQQGRMRYMLAEVSNTPWNERHYYALDLNAPHSHKKEFHVSPFNSMDQNYTWQVRPPGRASKKSMVHLQVAQQESGQSVFDATMVLKRFPLNQANLLRVLVLKPLQTLSIVTGIYWQALRLYLKGVPFIAHPSRRKETRKLAGGRSGR